MCSNCTLTKDFHFRNDKQLVFTISNPKLRKAAKVWSTSVAQNCGMQRWPRTPSQKKTQALRTVRCFPECLGVIPWGFTLRGSALLHRSGYAGDVRRLA
eukprot:1803488-Amphidinium_carterae.1